MNPNEFTAFIAEWKNTEATLNKGTEAFVAAESNTYITTWLESWEPIMAHPWQAAFMLWMESGNGWEPSDRTAYLLPKNVYDLGPEGITTYFKEYAEVARQAAQAYILTL